MHQHGVSSAPGVLGKNSDSLARPLRRGLKRFVFDCVAGPRYQRDASEESVKHMHGTIFDGGQYSSTQTCGPQIKGVLLEDPEPNQGRELFELL